MEQKPNPYTGNRYSAEIISRAVWLYFRFSLSFRDIEELLAYCGVMVTYAAIRQWTLKFGAGYANTLRRRQPRRGDKWYLDEMGLTFKGQHHYLGRAVDQDGYTLDILMQSRRDRKAAKRFFRKLLKGLRYVPRVIITDKLKSYGAAKREILPRVEHRQHKKLNNRVELSHQPTRQKEWQMRKFKSSRQALSFLSVHTHVGNLFRIRHRFETDSDYRTARLQAFVTWQNVTSNHRAA